MEDSKEIKEIEEVSDEGIQKTKGGKDTGEAEPRKGCERSSLKKPYVLTDARKAQFDKARLVRQSNIETKKKIQEEKDEIYNNIKADLLKKKDKKNVKKQKSQIKKLIEEVESDSDEEIIIKKVKAPKKKIIYVESDESEDGPYSRARRDSEREIIEKPKRKDKPKDVIVEKQIIVRQLKPLIRYF